jgi:hypothetical protein
VSPSLSLFYRSARGLAVSRLLFREAGRSAR